MIEISKVVFFVSLAILASCTNLFNTTLDSHCIENIEALGWLESADPLADVEAEVEAGDFRYKGVFGYSMSIPGLTRAEYRRAFDDSDVVPIEGTSDAICSDRHYELNLKAYKYAEKFNQHLKKNYKKGSL